MEEMCVGKAGQISLCAGNKSFGRISDLIKPEAPFFSFFLSGISKNAPLF